ncbi:hypothetical protein F8M41_003443 [Gigaspora margarita]|uniref:Uncharacterized protein n=1 Tax=Gigaspora margarita TaxID=4874 RepID=A0A8H4AY96_GIGMA|nr:hypothetical protein F8M41_003443 [Gigaspora margarita]
MKHLNRYRGLFSKQESDIITRVKEAEPYLLNQDRDIENCLGITLPETVCVIRSAIEKEEIERLVTKLTLALLESEILNYRNQELQSLISVCLNIYKRRKKKAKSMAMEETTSAKKTIKEMETPTKKKETKEAGPSNMTNQEIEIDLSKTRIITSKMEIKTNRYLVK